MNATITSLFTNDQNHQLKNAKLIYNDGSSDKQITNTGVEILNSTLVAEANELLFQLDKSGGSKAASGLKLQIPKNSTVEKGQYSAVVTWELVSGP